MSRGPGGERIRDHVTLLVQDDADDIRTGVPQFSHAPPDDALVHGPALDHQQHRVTPRGEPRRGRHCSNGRMVDDVPVDRLRLMPQTVPAVEQPRPSGRPVRQAGMTRLVHKRVNRSFGVRRERQPVAEARRIGRVWQPVLGRPAETGVDQQHAVVCRTRHRRIQPIRDRRRHGQLPACQRPGRAGSR